jgi:uncharacterized membrane protein YtjA (UPF0391 family)
LTGVIPPLGLTFFVPDQGRIFSFPPAVRGGTFVPEDDYFTECVSAQFSSWSVTPETKIEAEVVMLSWVVTFLVVALIAGILGFGGIAGVSIEIAKAIFFIAVILFIVSAVVGLARGRTSV